MKHFLQGILSLLFILSISLTSCTEPDSIGVELLKDDEPGVFYTDTFTLDCKSIREDSLRTDEFSAAFNLAGSYTDTEFGLTVAGFYSEIRLPNNSSNFSFGSDPALDSVVLTLAYADYYGDTTSPMNFRVFETDDKMFLDTVYFSNDTLNLKRSIFSGQVNIRPKDSVVVNGVKRAPHLRLKLDQTFGNDLLTAPSSSLSNNSAFIDFFNGIYVTADAATNGSISSFNLLASLSKLTFYYKNGSDTTSRTADFEINSGCSRYNRFYHDYSLGLMGGAFPIAGQSRIYIQSMSGTKARIKIPNLSSLSMDGPVAINKAELVIPVIENGSLKNHNALLLFGVDSSGSEAFIPDIFESPNYYGGTFDGIANAYRFNINRYVQKVVSNQVSNDYGLSLVASGGAINAFRTIIPGPATPTGSKIRLIITYSKFD
ncbi:MAG: DUF4270 domain-containing protein [Bacteroidota bacterium]|jgi:hypothetical protein